jgi:hypothetical protein
MAAGGASGHPPPAHPAEGPACGSPPTTSRTCSSGRR